MGAETTVNALTEAELGQTDAERLGWAIHGGGQEIAEGVLARLEVVGIDRRAPAQHVLEAIADTDRLGAEILGRWLATNQEITAEEGEQLSALGKLVGDVALPGLVKAYLAYRDIAVDLIEREAARLGSPEELKERAISMTELCTDGAMVTMCRVFDDERIRLAEELVQEQAKLEHQARHDPLTGLANRNLLTERVSEALATHPEAGKVALLFLDLDDFKAVNDSLGHDAGDRLLLECADRLRQTVRENDTVARLGGDEFVVLCTGLDQAEEQTTAMAARMLEALRRPVLIDDREIRCAVSVGVAVSRPGDDTDTLLINADAAMYLAKDGGGSRCERFKPEFGRAAAHRARLRRELRGAIERSELRVHYQPIAAADDGTVLSMEALVRWQHPEAGTIAPAEFIPIAERSDLIRDIDEWVLARACEQASRWRGDGWEVGISVNISVRHLDGQRLEQHVRGVLERTGLEPAALTLEITESHLMCDPEPIVAALSELSSLGVRMAIDDFGVGYSSLSYLQRLPVDSVKVDRSFVAGLGSEGHDPSLVQGIVGLAHRLGLAVVAEGVESEQELAAIKDLGCDEVQGFLLARPKPPEQLSHSARLP